MKLRKEGSVENRDRGMTFSMWVEGDTRKILGMDENDIISGYQVMIYSVLHVETYNFWLCTAADGQIFPRILTR